MYRNKNNGVMFMNYRIREDGRKINIFDKVNSIKSDIKALIPEIDDEQLIPILSHIRNFFYGDLHYGKRNNPENKKRKRNLTEVERIVLDYMLKKELNPSTTYRWFIACRVPADIKQKLAEGKISTRRAMRIASNIKHVRESNNGLLVMEEINNIVRSL